MRAATVGHRCALTQRASVYDITNTPNSHANEAIKTLNRFTRDTFGLGGIFHGAVEVNGEEYSFGYCPYGTGVRASLAAGCRPAHLRGAGVRLRAEGQPKLYVQRKHPARRHLHQRRSGAPSIPLSRPFLNTRFQFRRSYEGLQDEWQGWTYDLLSRNCNHFCEALVEILGVGPLPGAPLRCGTPPTPAHPHPAWVNRFAVNADYALETSQTALTEVKKIWKTSTDNVAAATGWLKERCVCPSPFPVWKGGCTFAHTRVH